MIATIKVQVLPAISMLFVNIALKETSVRAGFIHIPLIPEQNTDGSKPAMALETIVKGLKICAETTLAVQEDIKMGAGTIN